MPGNAAWDEGGLPVATPPAPVPPAAVPEARIAAIADLLRSGAPCLLFMTGAALGAAGLAAAGRIAEATGAVPLAQMSNARLERGAGRVPIDRLRYPVDQALEQLAGFRHVVLVGTREPSAFFAYPGKPSRARAGGRRGPSPGRARGRPGRGARAARPARRRAAPVGAGRGPRAAGALPEGALTGDKIAQALAAVMPEDAIVADESVSVGRNFFALTRNARPHSWLQVTGGAIGCGLPLATGAAIACPDRPVISLEADGSAMYTLQALWTQAREGLDVDHGDPRQPQLCDPAGRDEERRRRAPGPTGRDMMELDRPPLDWCALARGMGVEAAATDDAGELGRLLERGLATPGPFLIEARL